MYISQKHISRRTVLRGLGVTLGVPLLDAMVPARTLWANTAAGRAAGRTRMVCIEQVHGAAGCNELGASEFLWAPEAIGRNFDLSPGSLAPLEKFKDYLTIVSNADCQQAEAFIPEHIGGDHFLSLIHI